MKKTDEKLKKGMWDMGRKAMLKYHDFISNVSNFFHCQREEEMQSKCERQCEHCKEYYKGTDNGC